MSHGAKDKRRRARLWEANPHCHWCGTLTVLPPADGDSKRKHFPPNEATLDHLRPRGDPTRTVPPRNRERRLVLACRSCNGKRNDAQWPKEIRRDMTLRGKVSR